ncbi:MAG TPA: hypothetical protein VI462_04280 [Acidimicrobiia bacterium]
MEPRAVRRWTAARGLAVARVGAVVAAVVATAALATPASAARPVRDPARPRAASPRADTSTGEPLLGEAVREYTTMTATRYQHHDVEDAEAGTYYYDCVGFVTYAMSQATPIADATIRDEYHIAPDRVPAPGVFVHLFATLDGSQAGWEPVGQVADLRPGDVVAWSYDSASSSNEPGHDRTSRGHAFVVASAPQPSGTDSYLVQVWDSTGTPHGPNDTRRTNPKNLPDTGGKPSGLGTGTVRIEAGADGAIATVRWSPSSGPVPAAHFGMGRPVS